MRFGILHIVLGSLSYYRKQALNQFLIVAILASVISGSLLTGYSVRESLKRSVDEKLGNSDIVISSGLRYFSSGLPVRFSDNSGLSCAAITETEGVCQNFTTGEKVLRAKIYGIGKGFFDFNGAGNIPIPEGSAAVNFYTARKLGLKAGDDIILTLPSLSDIPASSPFAPSASNRQGVFRISKILDADSCGNFSLQISQSAQSSIFVNAGELFQSESKEVKYNTLLVNNPEKIPPDKITENLRNSLAHDDIDLIVRYAGSSKESEIISTRVFIDREITGQVKDALPEARPVITYLVNEIRFGDKAAPYSFVSALDEKSFPALKAGSSVIVNKWLADDIGAERNDTVSFTWFVPGKASELEERSEKFIISDVTEMTGITSDSLLMPEFPGIAGKESCSDWDAGVEIRMDRVRKKDEDYWNRYGGTPKAFISYNTGKEIWGNNFGPATAIRFGAPATPDEIVLKLKGIFDPGRSGFTVRDMRREMMTAADESVDFSTLFLSLGFFIIVSCIVLLVLAVKSWFESREKQIYSLFAIGFTNPSIRLILISETAIISFSGALAGALAGLAVNYTIIKALNSVWRGAVQTETMDAFAGIMPVLAGFISTFILSVAVLFLFTGSFLKNLAAGKKAELKTASARINLVLLLASGTAAVLSLILYLSLNSSSSSLSFASGGLFFIFLMLLWRQLVLSGKGHSGKYSESFLSASYYRMHSGRIIMPVLLIAAGLFAIVITGINRMKSDEFSISDKGGTGGYDLWAETTVPVKEDLNGIKGITAFGLEEFEGKFSIVQAKRSGGDDASCLNLNHVTSPPLLGIDPSSFIRNGSFSFSSLIDEADPKIPWEIITRNREGNLIYGFADQTVLDWGLKRKTGDTLMFRTESGELFKIVIAGGLSTSVFQGYICIDLKRFTEFYPSVSGSSVYMIRCEDSIATKLGDAIRMRLEPFGVSVQTASEKLEEFFEVTNTYLAVFTVLGGFGIMLGVIGLGFVLRFNYTLRRKEFALMLASGLRESNLKRIILREQLFILSAGIITGVVSGVVSTLSSISSGGMVQWGSLVVIVISIGAAGFISMMISMQALKGSSIIENLRRE